MLELRKVCKTFNRIEAVDEVSFSARAGEITGYLGPNGSGKSTTMKMLAGLMQPTSGTILFNGGIPSLLPSQAYRSRCAHFSPPSFRPGRAAQSRQ
jgi:ABC-type multidrug transport system ATPase subunit